MWLRYGENGDRILACGARVVIETESAVALIN